MAGFLNKVGEALHIGGDNKEAEKHQGEHKPAQHVQNYDQHGEPQKEGIMDKIKGQIGGGSEDKHDQHGEPKKEGIMDKIKDQIGGGSDDKHDKVKGEKKKKKDKKDKHEHGHGGDSSSSDSD